MNNRETVRHTVSTTAQFDEKLMAAYPSASSVSQAICMAADDGLTLRNALDDDLEAFVREVVRDELDCDE